MTKFVVLISPSFGYYKMQESEALGKSLSSQLGFPDGSDGKESAWNAGDLGLNSGLGKSTREGNGYSL